MIRGRGVSTEILEMEVEVGATPSLFIYMEFLIFN
jgi:hypothetical protein